MLKLLALLVLIAADIALGMSLPISQDNPPQNPGAWRDHRAAWAYMRLDNHAWLRAVWRSISRPMFEGPDEPPPDTPDEPDEMGVDIPL